MGETKQRNYIYFGLIYIWACGYVYIRMDRCTVQIDKEDFSIKLVAFLAQRIRFIQPKQKTLTWFKCFAGLGA